MYKYEVGPIFFFQMNEGHFFHECFFLKYIQIQQSNSIVILFALYSYGLYLKLLKKICQDSLIY